MSCKRSNMMNAQQRKNMTDLLELISTSNEPLLQSLADDIQMRRTFGRGMDSQESEQQSFDPSDSDKNVSNAQRHYDSEKQRLRNLGTNGNTNLNRSTAQPNLRELNSTPLSDANASKAKDVSAFARHPDQPAMDSHIVFRQEHMAKYR